jgi:spermidine synthase
MELKSKLKWLVVYNLIVAVLCIITQLALNTALTYIFSNSIFVYTFFTGLNLMSMGLGVFIVERFEINEKNVVKFLVINSLFVLFLANPGILFVLFANEYSYTMLRENGSDIGWITFPLGVLLSISIGICSGIELPVFSKLFETIDDSENPDEGEKSIITILTSDYLGAFLGSILFAFILFPFFGLVGSIAIIQFLVLICVNYFSYKFKLLKETMFLSVLVIFDFYIILSMIFKHDIVIFLDSMSL